MIAETRRESNEKLSIMTPKQEITAIKIEIELWKIEIQKLQRLNWKVGSPIRVIGSIREEIDYLQERIVGIESEEFA